MNRKENFNALWYKKTSRVDDIHRRVWSTEVTFYFKFTASIAKMDENYSQDRQ